MKSKRILFCLFAALLGGLSSCAKGGEPANNIPSGNVVPENNEETQGETGGNDETGSGEETETPEEILRLKNIYLDFTERYSVENVSKVKNQEISNVSKKSITRVLDEEEPVVEESVNEEEDEKEDGEKPEVENEEKEEDEVIEEINFTEQDKIIEEIKDETVFIDDPIEMFNILANAFKDTFETFFDEFKPFTFGNMSGFARLTINENIQEIHLTVFENKTYYYYTGFYLDKDNKRTLVSGDDTRQMVMLAKIEYSTENEDNLYPIHSMSYDYLEDDGLGTDFYVLNSDNDLRLHDLNRASINFKYPWIRTVLQNELKALIYSGSPNFEDHQEFRDLMDENFYDESIYAEFTKEVTYQPDKDLKVFYDENDIFTFSKDIFRVHTVAKQLFSFDDLQLILTFNYMSGTTTNISGNKYLETHVEKEYVFALGNKISIHEDYVEFRLPESFSLEDAIFVIDRSREYTTHSVYPDFEYDFRKEDGTTEYYLFYGYVDSKGNIDEVGDLSYYI